MKNGLVVGVFRKKDHSFSKDAQKELSLVEGKGVEGDAHFGETVKHRSRVAENPNQPNLRQVHLLPMELLEELEREGYSVNPGELGENITTKGVDLIELPLGTLLKIGESVSLEVTGLRDPCYQIDNFKKGLLSKVVCCDDDGNLVLKTGVMTVVLKGGQIKPNDKIIVKLPEKPFEKLEIV
ncbi:MAG: MOSC domain-containing protein [Nitrospinota bacterium]|nr:MOSC domain-containing protein [Nitrospinota bacterium]